MADREEFKVTKLRADKLFLGTNMGVEVTATAAEMSRSADGALATAAEVNKGCDGIIGSVATTATPASGSCGVQFVFSDVAGTTMAVPSAGLLYLSEVATGLTVDLADTTLAVLTNGALVNIGGAGPSLYVTTAAGLLGLTITAAADDYYVVFVQPSGLLLISSVCTVNA